MKNRQLIREKDSVFFLKVRMIGVFGMLLYVCLGSSLFAYQVMLDDKVFTQTGQGAQKKLTVSNTEGRPLAVEVQIKKRVLSVTGNETLEDIPEGWFFIYPSQLLLQPGEEEVIKAIWNNKVQLDKDLPLRFVVSQVNLVDPEEQKKREEQQEFAAKMDVLTRYVLSAYVRPKGAAPRIVLHKSEVIKTAEGPRVRMFFENLGKASQVMGRVKITVKPLMEDGRPDNKSLPLLLEENPSWVILAGQKFEVEMPLPKAFSSPRVQVDYTFSQSE